MKTTHVRVAFVALVLLFFATVVACTTREPAGPALSSPGAPVLPVQESTTKPAWEVEWDKIVTAGRKESKVVIYTSLEADASRAMSEAFKGKYGITLEIVTGTPNDTARRIVTERTAGLYIPDIHIGGTVAAITIIAPTGAFEPLDSVLILPEVTDPRVWYGGKLGWMEGDNKHVVYIFFSYVTPRMFYNTDIVKEGEVKSWNDLLSPKWTDKIVMGDPTVPSSASLWFARTFEAMGEKYLRDLVKQKPTILRDERLVAEWLAHAKYPVAIAVANTRISEFVRAGAHIGFVKPAEYMDLTSGSGLVSLLNKAPHPNAAKVFINWLLTKEGQTIVSEAADAQSRRDDVPTDKITPLILRPTGIKLIEDTQETIYRRTDDMKLAKDIFGSLMAR